MQPLNEMRLLAFVTLILLTIIGKSQDHKKHELGINLAHTPYYINSVWDESSSFLQVISPITYKYFIESSSALRINMQYRTQERNISGFNSFENLDASKFSFGAGYQKLFGTGKLKPTLFSDLTFVTEDYYLKNRNLGLYSTLDFSSIGVEVSGGAGLRYEFHPRWALAYEAQIGLYTQRKNGYEEVGGDSKTQWNDAVITNRDINPVSNVSINFRF